MIGKIEWNGVIRNDNGEQIGVPLCDFVAAYEQVVTALEASKYELDAKLYTFHDYMLEIEIIYYGWIANIVITYGYNKDGKLHDVNGPIDLYTDIDVKLDILIDKVKELN